MEKGINRKNQIKRLRWFALGCLSGVAEMCALCASGLRINGTRSEPVGIYWAVGKELGKGDFVFALPPAEPVFALGKERGYLGPGPSPAGTSGGSRSGRTHSPMTTRAKAPRICNARRKTEEGR
jgi:type IV secretory pathway protease TraF